MKRRMGKRMAAALLGLLVIGGSLQVVAAVQGSQDNPLITLSYLKNVFAKDVLAQADTKIQAAAGDYEKKLNDKLAGYQGGTGTGTSSPGGATFAVVDIPAGKSLVGAVGCEVMLRVGSAHCQSPGSPGLIDATSGTVLEGGSPLQKNHLYLMTIEGRSVLATQGAVKVLVRGGYTIQ